MKSVFMLGSAMTLLLASAPAMALAASGEPTSVSELVVTGEKAGRTVQQTPTSVAIVTAERISEEGLSDLYDVFEQVANVNARFGDAGFVIRGVDAFNVSPGGAAGLASLYYDGVALPRKAVEAGPLQVWDVEQIELLRGPQSTLQGRNALAGAIYVSTQQPTFAWGGRARAIAKEGDRREYAIAGGGPIVADQVAFRVSIEDIKADGFVRNPTRNEDAFFEDATTIRAGLYVLPAQLPKLSVLLSYLDSERAQGDERSLINVPDFWDKRINPSDGPGRIDTDTNLVSARIGYDLSDAIQLSSVSGWVRSHYVASADADLTALPLEPLSFDRLEESYSQEFRANFDFGRLKGVAGLYGSDTNVEDMAASRVQFDLAATAVPLLMANFGLTQPEALFVVGQYPALLPIDSTQDNPFRVRSYAAFADASFELNERWELLGGLRLDREQTRRSADNTARLGVALPNPALYPFPTDMVIFGLNSFIGAEIAQANGTQAPTTAEFDAFLPKLGLRYSFSDDISAALVVQRGYRSGGSSTNYAQAEVVEYDPEYTWNYEAAFRSRFRDGRLVFNANAFWTDWKDQQVPLQLSANIYDVQTANAGESHLYGLELEMSHRLSANLKYYASAGYVRTRFDEFVFRGADLAGNEFANAPRYSAAIGAAWQNDSGVFVDVNANYKSAAYDQIAPSLGQVIRPIDARTLVNFKAGWEGERFGAYVTGQNIFDERYVLASDFGQGYAAQLGQPQVFGIALEAKW